MPALYKEEVTGLTARSSTQTPLDVVAAHQVAVQFAKESGELREEMLPGILKTQAATGLQPREALGALLTVGQKGGISDTHKLVKELGATMAGGKEFGATWQEAGAVMAGMARGSGQTEGRGLGPAGWNLIKDVAEAYPAETRRDPRTHRLLARGTGLADFASRVQHLRETPKEMERFFAEHQFGIFEPGARQVLEGRGVGGQTAAETLADLNVDPSQLGQVTTTKIRQMARPGIQTVAAIEREQEGAAEQGRLESARQQREGLFSWQAAEKQLKASGLGGWALGAASTGWSFRAGGNQEAYQDLMKSRIRGLRVKSDPDSLHQADVLEATLQRQLALAEKLDQSINEMNAQLEKQTALMEKAQQTPSPVAVQENRNQHGPGQALSFWDALGTQPAR